MDQPAETSATRHTVNDMRMCVRATWKHAIALAARLMRLPKDLIEDLEDEASMAMAEIALHFEPVDVNGPPIVGWRCQHMSMTSGAGIISRPPTTSWCDCAMEPVYA